MSILCTQAIFHNQSYFLALIDRIFPETYIAPLKSPGPGYELLQGFAKLFEKMSLATARIDCGDHILQSFGAAFSTCVVDFSRPDTSPIWPVSGTVPPGIEVVIKAGTVVTTSKGDKRFVTTTDVNFLPGELGPKGAIVIATEPAFEFNVPGKVITKRGELLPGEIDTIRTLIADPPFPSVGRPNFTVAQDNAATGGCAPMLDALGRDRGLPRHKDEDDESYRTRIRTLPDTISPDAIIRNVTSFLAPILIPLGYHFDFIETWDPNYQTCWDCPSPNITAPYYSPTPIPGIDQNLFCYDDPRPAYPPFRNRWLDEIDYRGAFIITVPDLPAIANYGFVLDDPAMNPAALTTSAGFRSVSAFDIPSFYTSSHVGVYDGPDNAKSAIYKGLYDLLQKIKAAGVYATVELQGQ